MFPAPKEVAISHRPELAPARGQRRRPHPAAARRQLHHHAPCLGPAHPHALRQRGGPHQLAAAHRKRPACGASAISTPASRGSVTNSDPAAPLRRRTGRPGDRPCLARKARGRHPLEHPRHGRGISASTVSRWFRLSGLKPHLAKTCKLSADPCFIEKVRDIAALYIDPPGHATVLRVDELSQT